MILGTGVDGRAVRVDVDRLLASRLLLQANSGGGKSWALRLLLEQTHGKVQQLVLDVEGEFHTLREKFDYVHCRRGGDEAPADPRSAALLAQKLLQIGMSAIVDLYELKKHERILVVRRFLESLIEAPKELWHPVLVVIDEAHLFCPQAGEAESAAAVIDLMTRGRKRGFCGVLATQRLSKLHKDAAAEANCKLIGRASQDIDMKRAGDELGFTSREDLQRLRALPAGRFFAFGPGISDVVLELQVGDVVTTHPRPGSGVAPVPPPRDKVKRVLGQLKDLPQEAAAEAKTLAEAKAEIAKLRRELAAKPAAPAPKVERVEVSVLKDAHVASLGKHCDGVSTRVERLTAVMAELRRSIAAEREQLAAALLPRSSGIHHPARPPARVPSSSPVVPAQAARPAAQEASGDVRIGRCERVLLSVLVQHGACSMVRLSRLSGYSFKSSGFTNALGALRSAGLISPARVNPIGVTAAGLALSGGGDPLPQGQALVDHWFGKLGKCERAIADALLQQPAGLTGEQIAEATQYSHKSSGFTNAMGALRSLGLITPARVEPIRLCDELLVAGGVA